MNKLKGLFRKGKPVKIHMKYAFLHAPDDPASRQKTNEIISELPDGTNYAISSFSDVSDPIGPGRIELFSSGALNKKRSESQKNIAAVLTSACSPRQTLPA